MYDPRIWHSRGYIPHINPGEMTQFITFRLADSMPQSVLATWKDDLKKGEITDAGLRKRIETYLDQNYGKKSLSDNRIATLVQNSILHLEGKKYRLIAWVIMPNHVHILIITLPGYSVSEIMHSLKSYTSHEANKILGRTGSFWYKEYFDRYIRDGKHFRAVVRYIEENPVKAKLCKNPEDWKLLKCFLQERALNDWTARVPRARVRSTTTTSYAAKRRCTRDACGQVRSLINEYETSFRCHRGIAVARIVRLYSVG